MSLNDLLKHTCEWLKGSGPNSDIVLSSRVRLARNLSKIPFSHWANRKQLEEIYNLSEEAILATEEMRGGLFLCISELSNVDKQLLIERHLISREHIVKPEYKAVAISEHEIISVMVNEEDHLRIQLLQSGFNLQAAWSMISKFERELEKKLDFAFSPQWGFLTACPTNTGTGLRASVMLHLPALVITRQIQKVLQAISKLSMTARGFYGEGTEASGNFFQISNQVALGHSEEEVIDNIERVLRQVIGHEQNARQTLLTQDKDRLEDRIARSYATLKSAHIITSQETIDLFSAVRLGIDLGLVKDLNRDLLNDLLLITQPAHLQKIEGKILSSSQRDVKRAEIIKEKILKKK
jgi:protein arginine kinase